MAKKKAATQPGAADETAPEPTARETAIEEIARKQRETRDEEMGAAPADPPPADDPPPNDPPADPPADPPVIEYETIKIDGVDTQVDKTKVYDTGKRALAKELAADKRLADASEMLRKAEETERRATEMLEKAGRVAQPGDGGLELSDEELGSIAHAIKYGDDTQTTEGIKNLVKSIRGAKATKGDTLNKTEIQAIIAEEREKAKFDSALEQIKKPAEQGGYGDLFDGGLLYNALAFEDDRLAKSDEWKGKTNYLDRLKAAGENVRNKLNPTKPGDSPNNDSEREQRKANLGSAPSGASGTPPAAPKKHESETDRHARVIREMADQRRPGR